MLGQEENSVSSSSPSSASINMSTTPIWMPSTVEKENTPVFEDTRARQVRTPDILDHEPTPPPIKPKRVGIFVNRADLEETRTELGSLFRQAQKKIEKIQALEREKAPVHCPTPTTASPTKSGSSPTSSNMSSPTATTFSTLSDRDFGDLGDISDDVFEMANTDSWYHPLVDRDPFNQHAVRKAHLFETHDVQVTIEEQDSDPFVDQPETHQAAEPQPVQPDINGGETHVCTVPQSGGHYGCADMPVRIVHDTAFNSGPYCHPDRCQGTIDVVVCDRAMSQHLIGWDQVKINGFTVPKEPVYLYTTSNIHIAKYGLRWLLDQIHYPSGEADYLSMQELSNLVELLSQFEGAGPHVVNGIQNALIYAEIQSLEDVLFGLHVTTFPCCQDLFFVFRDFLTLNVTGAEVVACMLLLRENSPYLWPMLYPHLNTSNIARRRIIHDIIHTIETAIVQAWQPPVDIGFYHFLCALKFRFMSHQRLEKDFFDLAELMRYMRDVVSVQPEPYGQLLADFEAAFARRSILSDFSPFPFVIHQHYF